jgi:hypothetical protein
MITLAEPLTPRTEQQMGCTAGGAALSPRRGGSFFSVWQKPMRNDFSQRGFVTFPLLGERVRVRASHTVNCIVPAKTISGVPASA